MLTIQYTMGARAIVGYYCYKKASQFKTSQLIELSLYVPALTTMKLVSLLVLFTASLTGVSLAYPSTTEPPSPDNIKEIVCETLSPEMVATKCKDPEFVRSVREHIIDGISPEELCRDPRGVLDRICPLKGPKGFAKSQQKFHTYHRESYPGQRKAKVQQPNPDFAPLAYLCSMNLSPEELSRHACKEEPRICPLPPTVAYKEVCGGYNKRRVKMQRPDLPYLCSLNLPIEEILRRACEEDPRHCGQSFEQLCPNRPRPSWSFAARSQQTEPKPLFLRVIEFCKSIDQSGDVQQKLDVLCEGLPSWIRHGRVLPSSASTPIADEVQEIIAKLCIEDVDEQSVPDVVTPCNDWKAETHQICDKEPSLLGCSLFKMNVQP